MKKKIGVIFGGQSSEYSVSLESVSSLLKHIDQSRYDIYMIGINQNGEWKHFDGDIQDIENNTWDTSTFSEVLIDVSHHCLLEINNECMSYVHVDALLPILHGKNGEDGTVQGMIQMAKIPLIGCGVLSSALCMDKYRAHELVKANGIDVPHSVYLSSQEVYQDKKMDILNLKLPLFIKPIKSGSSLGICRIDTFDDLDKAIQQAFLHDDEVIVEEEIPGFEVGCAVMGIDELVVGRVDEIELSSGFFDFKEKYNLITSQIHVPARITPILEKQIQETAKEIYRILGCRIFARVDMFLTPDHRIVFNEVNTIPGFTVHSRYPNMMKEAGISFQELLTQFIEMGIKDANKNNL